MITRERMAEIEEEERIRDRVRGRNPRTLWFGRIFFGTLTLIAGTAAGLFYLAGVEDAWQALGAVAFLMLLLLCMYL